MNFFYLANQVFVPDENGNVSPLPSNEAISQSPNLGAAFAQMLLTFAGLIVLLVITYWLVRRLIQNRLQKGSAGGYIHVIEKKMISPKTMLYFVDVEGQKILFAESQLEIEQLKPIAPTSEKGVS